MPEKETYWGGATPDVQEESLASNPNASSNKAENQAWRTAKKTNYKIKFSSVAPSGVEDFQLNKDSNWDPNSVAEDWRFPWIYDPVVYQDYLDHQRDCLNVKSTLTSFCCFLFVQSSNYFFSSSIVYLHIHQQQV